MEENIIINKIESEQPRLSSEERSSMWHVVEASLPVAVQPVVSPYYSFITLHYKTMTAFALMLVLIISGGGTAYASNAARPGDTLFPLDRALEDIQLRLAQSDDSRAQLTASFTEERLKELREIVDEELVVSPTNVGSQSATATSTQSAFEISARVFLDTTVVKLTIDGEQFYFEAPDATKAGVIAEIHTRFPVLSIESIDAQLDFKVEDRASRPQDRGIVSLSSHGEERINRAVQEILSFLDTAGDGALYNDSLRSMLSREIENVTSVRRHDDGVEINGGEHQRFEVRVDDNGDSKLEVRDGSSRVRVEEKDGEVRVRTSKESEHDGSLLPVNDVRIATTGTVLALSLEARVFTDTTVVQLEFGDNDVNFQTSATTRKGVIEAVKQKFPALTLEQIDAHLDFKVENRRLVPVVTEKPVDVPQVRTDSDDRNDDEDEDEKDEDHGGSGHDSNEHESNDDTEDDD